MAIFLDSNVLVYPYDRREPERGKRALEILHTLATSSGGTVSSQVLGEFFWAITRRLPDPVSATKGVDSVERHARTWRVLDVTLPVVREALRGVRQHSFPYWDSLIWATARLAQIPLVLSEDFSDGSETEGVLFRNPFRKGFTLEAI